MRYNRQENCETLPNFIKIPRQWRVPDERGAREIAEIISTLSCHYRLALILVTRRAQNAPSLKNVASNEFTTAKDFR